MTDDSQTSAEQTDAHDTASGERPAGGERPTSLIRDVLLPALLALAIMAAVWWYWRVAVVDVGARATP